MFIRLTHEPVSELIVITLEFESKLEKLLKSLLIKEFAGFINSLNELSVGSIGEIETIVDVVFSNIKIIN